MKPSTFADPVLRSIDTLLKKVGEFHSLPVAIEARCYCDEDQKWDSDYVVVLDMDYLVFGRGEPWYDYHGLGNFVGTDADVRAYKERKKTERLENPWAEGAIAKEVGEHLAARLKIPFWFPSPNLPNENSPRWWQRDDEKEICQVVSNIEKAWNTHDMALYRSQFRWDADWIDAKGTHWRGLEAHATYHATILENHNFKTDVVETRSIGDGFAIAVVSTTMEPFTTPDGQSIPKRNDRLTYVLARGGRAGWVIVHGHNVRVDLEAVKNDPVIAKR